MQDRVSRLVGLDGFEVKRVIERGDRLDLEVELVARAGCCPRCGRSSVEVKDRPVVRVRDLPIAGRVTYLVWRRRRYRCRGCGPTFTESHPELPPRRRVSRRFRLRLFERVGGGAAHAEVARCERTTRYRVAAPSKRARWTSSPSAVRRGRRGGCRSTRPTTAAAASSPRSSRTSTVGAWSSCSTGAAAFGSSATCARCQRRSGRRSRSSRATPTRPTARRSTTSCPGPGSWSTTSTSCAAPTPPSTRSGASASASTAGGSPRGHAARARAPAGAPSSTAPATACSRPASGSQRASDAGSARCSSASRRSPRPGRSRKAFRSIYRAGDRHQAARRLDHFLAAVGRAQLAAFTAFADGVRLWRPELLAYFDQPTTNGYAEGVINKVKVIKRRAYGLPRFDGFRERVLLACA